MQETRRTGAKEGGQKEGGNQRVRDQAGPGQGGIQGEARAERNGQKCQGDSPSFVHEMVDDEMADDEIADDPWCPELWTAEKLLNVL